MSKPELLEKTPMNIVEVKTALEKIKATEPELNFRAQKAEEYAQDFAKISLKESKELLEKIKATEPELNFRAQKAEEYSQDFAKISTKEAKELLEKLKGLDIPRLKEQHLHKMIDLMPTNEKQVKIILSSYNITPTVESCKKIADAISEYAPKRH